MCRRKVYVVEVAGVAILPPLRRDAAAFSSVKLISLTDFSFPQSFKVFHGKILSRLVELLEDRETGWSKSSMDNVMIGRR